MNVGGKVSDVTEVIDIPDEAEALDVDAFINEVLLTKVTIVKPDPDGGRDVAVARPAPHPFIKPEPEG